MGETTKIAWSDSTWTPLRARRLDTGKIGVHCEKVSEGCKNCYAERLNMRNLPSHGTGYEFNVLNTPKVEMFIDEKILAWPLKWKKPRMIFVCSQTDLFAEFVSDPLIDLVFSVMARCPQHTFQVLTKRAKRMKQWVSIYKGTQECPTSIDSRKRNGTYFNLPLPNVWLGVSVENQERADERIPLLLDTPAAKKFVSAEPLLGPIDLTPKADRTYQLLSQWYSKDGFDPTGSQPLRDRVLGYFPNIDWIIVGGESGPGARPFEIQWAESLIEQCKAAEVACFVKQLGNDPRWAGAKALPINPAFGKNDQPAAWPESLRVQEFPNASR